MSRTVSQKGIDIIKYYEGCYLTAYQDTGGVWTIGYGTTNYDTDITGLTIKKGVKITQKQAEDFLTKTINKSVCKYVNNKNFVPIIESLNQNQFDALVSFTYNCGCGNLKKLCAGRTAAQISEHFGDYIKDAKGNVLNGLIKRRNTERELFNTEETITVKKNNSCLKLQKAINKDKIAVLKENGICEKSTKEAINKIMLSAKKDPKTGKYTVGSKGYVVEFVQDKLGLVKDKKYGADTRKKVIEFQNKKGLVPDGICGPKTLLKMI